MLFKKDFDLKAFNTFGISSIAAQFAEVDSYDTLISALEQSSNVFILGGGSNLLLPERIEKCVLRNAIPGIEILDEDEVSKLVKVGGGVVWHDLVTWAVNNDLGGLENLALIPGTVGAAPIQNIGAYGVEIEDVFLSLEYVNLKNGKVNTLNARQCNFGYRDSIFKHGLKDACFITSVLLKLSKADNHVINLDYKSLKDALESKRIEEVSIRDVFNTVIEIRRSKLPDPAVLGNSGSFFKNVEVGADELEELLLKNDDMVYYDLGEEKYKIPTGWLIEKTGWKGRKVGAVGCYEKQALVLVNHGGGTSSDIKNLAAAIQRDVLEKFGLTITPEVNFI